MWLVLWKVYQIFCPVSVDWVLYTNCGCLLSAFVLILSYEWVTDTCSEALKSNLDVWKMHVCLCVCMYIHTCTHTHTYIRCGYGELFIYVWYLMMTPAPKHREEALNTSQPKVLTFWHERFLVQLKQFEWQYNCPLSQLWSYFCSFDLSFCYTVLTTLIRHVKAGHIATINLG